ncbi:tRNA (guanine-N(1)-)-methyltransferase,tRNA (guanine-N(1)-)-methyltransferase/unknown domain fusion protein,tRNA-(guanine-N1)-methyltransferase,tRNA (guanine(37)-N(1))-methyltransferase,tRNA (Guanine-1)-methyltransferase [Chlamydia serpentis]|uniref:tRNA (guanine-N(1)-)-methyltransferase n=1 Tax=Chlamydia serpentis TaxID=1967782 RepID=A0A2R8FA41_9CHLA|nr:tRNA (guanosine(37)-N1)-methyltransferase TrmD [Chlamydia serpentis]SPN73283.1 tRNA (guanine-N(1)-)-methyltransferase,tRNA (guanine-N(1)-)-methyltransferase/unknown domain fusion protein,tRNA-(guanine-N1)-methyltransferase,tRNA (guanine(37)-N(1))-methyltransferase,tRNA (Guanine-1)-methyltransferase [Chlamydia serpentis]
MKIDILSLFPGYFDGPLQTSILGRALEQGLLDVQLINLRDFGLGKWKQVDDTPFGCSGMLLMAEPVTSAIRSIRKESSRVVYLSPQGALLTAEKSRELAQTDHLILLCGHYEGIDERAIESEVDEEISIGDYVLTNGAVAALVLIDAVSRFVPGVLGNQESAESDSLENGLLKGPQYTRPRIFEGKAVPEVLLQGNHNAIAQWRLDASKQRTCERRPDLYLNYLYNRSMSEEFGVDSRENQHQFKCGKIAIILEVKKLKQAKSFYCKVFRCDQPWIGLEDKFCLPDEGKTLFWLQEVGAEKKNTTTLSVYFNSEEDFLCLLRRWELFGGTLLEKHANEHVVLALAEDLDGHVWMFSWHKIK